MATAVPAFAGIPRVNLMPPLEVERRRRGSLVRGWVWGVVAAVVVAFFIVAGAFVLKFAADQSLVAEQAKTTALLTELASLSEVSGALATEGELTSFRSEAMAADFAWAPVIATVTSALPSGVRLVGFDLVSGGVPQTDDPTAEVGLVGRLTLSSSDPIDLPATVRGIRELEGVAMVDGQSLATSELSVGAFRYELDIALDQTIYSGRYAQNEGGE